MTDQDTNKAACDLAKCPVPRVRCGFCSNGLPCRHPSWRDAWERGRQHLQEVEEKLEEVRKHVAHPDLVHCPDCPDQGWYARGEKHSVYEGTDHLGYPIEVGEAVEWEQVQCEFCWTMPNSYFNHQREKLADVREHVKAEQWQEADYDARHVL